MPSETEFTHMSQLLRPGETGLCIFTEGDYFELDARDGSGSTGWWDVNVLRRVDWIFVYYKHKRNINQLYMARCGNLSGPNKHGKYRIGFREAKQVGFTKSDWIKFGGGAGRGLRYFS